MWFVKTKDAETAAQLRKAGLTEVTEAGSGLYTFINNEQVTMQFEDNKKLQFGNLLNM